MCGENFHFRFGFRTPILASVRSLVDRQFRLFSSQDRPCHIQPVFEKGRPATKWVLSGEGCLSASKTLFQSRIFIVQDIARNFLKDLLRSWDLLKKSVSFLFPFSPISPVRCLFFVSGASLSHAIGRDGGGVLKDLPAERQQALERIVHEPVRSRMWKTESLNSSHAETQHADSGNIAACS